MFWLRNKNTNSLNAGFFQYHQGVKQSDPDQARHFVGPDLDPNCLQRFQQMTKVDAGGKS